MTAQRDAAVPSTLSPLSQRERESYALLLITEEVP